jgi:hypothetical protein
MEPARGERDDLLSIAAPPTTANMPQWSPLVVSGMTRLSPVSAALAGSAAMEAARGERDDRDEKHRKGASLKNRCFSLWHAGAWYALHGRVGDSTRT